jgi:mutator protein MutT
VAEKELPVIPCGVALIRDERRFLIAQRCSDDSFGSKWEFPGGKKEADETFEQCVAREVKEEVGIDVEVREKLMEIRRPYHERIIWLNFYICSPVSGEPRPVECQKVLWADVDELAGYDFPPANDRVIEKLKALFG